MWAKSTLIPTSEVQDFSTYKDENYDPKLALMCKTEFWEIYIYIILKFHVLS